MQRSLIAHFRPKSPVAEQYRTIRTNLQYATLDPARKIVVTSTAPSEGKSTTAANVATMLSQQDKRVLLIDADLRKPTTHYTFTLENHVGLTTMLIHQTKLDRTAQKTAVPYLDVLTSGPIPPKPAELLGSERMDWLLETAQEEYDYVVMDTPPILAVTDAQVLSTKSDGVILVAGSGSTKQDDAVKAKELLTNVSANILGVVLNKRQKKQGGYYYYYGEK
ncbi:CpsD/CapB family tyrosine-protein kinase [Alkalicoccus saliphilus]|uniref:non-specific protein-tyrosine kinase n=1 Tax=Alkalicoccus saliphilus TaxID=200989 RepID=A0A2T4U1V1_9BACI|nr:CpsD/CapB family tyrosine-protein kinase [Alkalicoccus saliphilus]PTL37373.1 capsular biosynthesis protein [Alkalicoccus saliphilus]